MPNSYCDRLGIVPPRLLDVALREWPNYLDLLVFTLLARGEPMPMDEIVGVLAPLWTDTPESLRISLTMAWAGKEPIVKDAQGRLTLDLESWRIGPILERLGLRGPPTPPPEPEVPPPEKALTIEEVNAAFGNGCPFSGVRFAAAILDVFDRPMLPVEISAAARGWTAAWIPAPIPSRKGAVPGLVGLDAHERLVLNRSSPEMLTMRAQIRKRARPALRRAAHAAHYGRLADERERMDAERLAAIRAAPAKPSVPKVDWHGTVAAVQPRIRLTRSYDQRSHSYLGFVLRVRGDLGGEAREFVVAVGKAAHDKNQFRVGDSVSGQGVRVEDPDLETADLYKVSAVRIGERGPVERSATPPFTGVPPPPEEYQARGHRRLAALTYAAKCESCVWGCEMAVEMIIDQWSPSKRRYRRETFCYGPKSCPQYAAGPARKVPGRHGSSWTEEDWVDEEATGHRGEDD